SAPASPWQNPYVERVIGSIRRECLDHMIVLNARHLRRILTIYSRYYHRSRTHLGLEKDAPDPRPVSPPSEGPIIAIPEVGGLHPRYERLAAYAPRPDPPHASSRARSDHPLCAARFATDTARWSYRRLNAVRRPSTVACARCLAEKRRLSFGDRHGVIHEYSLVL